MESIQYTLHEGTRYLITLMALWMALNDLEGANTKRYWKGNGVRKSKHFVYKQPFGMHFKYRHHVDEQNNRWYAPISIETTRATKFWDDRNFDWYLAVSTVNGNLAHGHFQKGGGLTLTLQFRRELDQELFKNDAEDAIRGSISRSIFFFTILFWGFGKESHFYFLLLFLSIRERGSLLFFLLFLSGLRA